MNDRDQWRAALRAEPVKPGDCYRHDMRPAGGGACCQSCGLTVDCEEL